jgi:SPP1 gp7 family putative phage head morphogenesis protein
MVKTVNEELHDAMVRHQTYLLRYSGYVRNRINTILDATEQDIADKIRARLANAPGGLTGSYEVRRMQALQDQITTIRQKAWDKANDDLKSQMTQLSLAESVSFGNTVTIVLPVTINVVQPSARLLRSIALSRPFQGRVLNDWARDMAADDIRRIHNAIQVGMTEGQSMDAIVRRVIGTGALNYADGVTELTRSNVQSIVRTAVMHISNHSRAAWMQENTDIIASERFVATLDSRTTPICRANDGKEFDVGTGPQPPLHFGCRSLRVAVLDGTLLGDRPAKPYTENLLARQYAEENGFDDVSTRDDLPHGTKGDFDKWKAGEIRNIVGPVPADTTYQEWLGGQSNAFQDDLLGPTRAKLFRDGDLKLDRFVNRQGDELTLHELASREADAFRSAGLNPDDF